MNLAFIFVLSIEYSRGKTLLVGNTLLTWCQLLEKEHVDICFCSDIYRPIPFKLSMMVWTIGLSFWYRFWMMTLRVKVVWEITQMFMIMFVEMSCKYGEYGSFEHLLFLLKRDLFIWSRRIASVFLIAFKKKKKKKKKCHRGMHSDIKERCHSNLW